MEDGIIKISSALCKTEKNLLTLIHLILSKYSFFYRVYETGQGKQSI